MKRIKLMIMAGCLFASALCEAQTFSDDNFQYEILSMEDLTVKVLPLSSKEYEGTVTIPAEVEYKGRLFKIAEYRNSLFNGCANLKEVYLPKGVPTSENMFKRCKNLDWQMVFDQMEGTIPAGIFWDCAPVTDLVIPARFNRLEEDAFGPEVLNTITLENASEVFSISNSGCFNCKHLIIDREIDTFLSGNNYIEELEVGSNILRMRYAIFSKMPKLEKAVFKGANTEVPSYCFSGCESLTSVEFPEGITYISDYCFKDCKALKSYVFPESITNIGGEAFCNSGLETLVIPANVHNVGALAFKDCKSLKEITLQSTDDMLNLEMDEKEFDYGYKSEESPFSGCDNLSKIYLDRPVSYALTQNCSVTYNPLSHDPYPIYHYSCEPLYPNLQEVVFGSVVYEVPEYFLTNYTYPVSVKLGDNIKIIGKEAFSGCKWLTALELPESVEIIGDKAFANTSLSSIDGMKNVKEFGEGVFKDTKIKEFYCPDNVTNLSDGLLSGCRDLKLVFIQEGLETISGTAFENNSSLSEIYCRCAVTPVFGEKEGQHFSNQQYFNVNVYVPEESLAAYQAAPVWSVFLNLQAFDFSGTGEIADDVEGSHVKLAVYDLSGKRVKATDTNRLPKGFYIISDGSGTRKVMIK